MKLADIVTRVRTAVERDFKGEVIDAHAPEMPTRFAKQLTQIVRGGVAIGIPLEKAMGLAVRFAGVLNTARKLVRSEQFQNGQVAYPGVWTHWESGELRGRPRWRSPC